LNYNQKKKVISTPEVTAINEKILKRFVFPFFLLSMYFSKKEMIMPRKVIKQPNTKKSKLSKFKSYLNQLRSLSNMATNNTNITVIICSSKKINHRFSMRAYCVF